MRLFGSARRLSIAGVSLLTATRRLVGAMLAAGLLVAASPAMAKWPEADPAQPLVQAPRVCASGIVPLDRRCYVKRFIQIAPAGRIDDHSWWYAFYDTHWADRHGKQDRGFPIIFYLEAPATLRLSLWVDDAPGLAGRWARTASPDPVLILRPAGAYMGMSLKTQDGPDDQRLFRMEGIRWRQLHILAHSDADQKLIDQATPDGCRAAAEDSLYDWKAFQLRIPLQTRDTGAPCGNLLADLGVDGLRLYVTRVRLTR